MEGRITLCHFGISVSTEKSSVIPGNFAHLLEPRFLFFEGIEASYAFCPLRWGRSGTPDSDVVRWQSRFASNKTVKVSHVQEPTGKFDAGIEFS